jgi:beta-1,4-mannosyl-glycoprotein beta-1,4-N-acetylglucosaminyltransferase
MIYDCFTFFNELDLLEIRLQELEDVVDYFVIVESRTTYDGKRKPLYYKKNAVRFRRWRHKIIHVETALPELNVLDHIIARMARVGFLYRFTFPSLGFGRWKREHALRNAILQGLSQASEDDVIMVSDVDEIPKATIIGKVAALAQRGKTVGLRQRLSIYYINGITKHPWIGTKACTLRTLRQRFRGKPQYLRVPFIEENLERHFGRPQRLVVLPRAGWHLSSLGGTAKIVEKMSTGSHTENTQVSDAKSGRLIADIDAGIFRFKDSILYRAKYKKIDRSYPRAIREHPSRYSHLIRDT